MCARVTWWRINVDESRLGSERRNIRVPFLGRLSIEKNRPLGAFWCNLVQDWFWRLAAANFPMSTAPAQVLLCIDDRPPILQLRKTRLETRGYSVVTATNTAAAIAMLEKSAIAVVILEYKSEGMDAEAVAFHIKQRFPDQPILLLSGYSELPGRVLWLVDEWVMKSEPLEGLGKVIERVLRTSEQGKPPKAYQAAA